jgi:hypothetical protein
MKDIFKTEEFKNILNIVKFYGIDMLTDEQAKLYMQYEKEVLKLWN